MQKIAAAHLQPGMIIARNIFSTDGILLLSADTVLNAGFIERLRRQDINSVYIKNPLLSNLSDNEVFDSIPEVVREETRIQAVQMVQRSFENIKTTQRVNVRQFQDTAVIIINEVIRNNVAMIHLTDIRAHDGYTFGHSVNVCVLAAITGVQLGYNMDQLRELALGALLHDVGKMFIPKDILLKAGPLTDEEMNIMRQHPDLGFDILRSESEMSLLSAHVAFQHHEKFDGTGYTRSLSGHDIHEYSRIVAIADVYDAITSDRPYKDGELPHEAFEIMAALSDSHFDPNLLTIFLSQVAIYPHGTVVKLNTGEVALVIKVAPGLQTRPTIKIIMNEYNQSVQDGRVLDLTKHLTISITKVLTPEEVFSLHTGVQP